MIYTRYPGGLSRILGTGLVPGNASAAKRHETGPAAAELGLFGTASFEDGFMIGRNFHLQQHFCFRSAFGPLEDHHTPIFVRETICGISGPIDDSERHASTLIWLALLRCNYHIAHDHRHLLGAHQPPADEVGQDTGSQFLATMSTRGTS